MSRYKKSYTGERRTVHVGFYITPSEAAILDAAAERQGAARSDFARELIFRRLGMPGIVAGARRNPEKAALLAGLRAAAFEHDVSVR